MDDRLEEAINLTDYLIDRCDDLYNFLDAHIDVLQAVNDGPRKIEYVGFTARVEGLLAEVAYMLRDMRSSLIEQVEEEQCGPMTSI